MKTFKLFSLVFLFLALFCVLSNSVKADAEYSDTREACLKRGGVWQDGICIGPDRR